MKGGNQSSFSSAEPFSRVGSAMDWMAKDSEDSKDELDDALHDWRGAQ